MKNKITDNIFNVGVLNPNIRVADIVVKTNNGTSYNSYIVKGSDKTALIETAHKDYFENYLKNIQEIISIDQIDYIIMNHNEPDHSGSISKLIELNPNLTIVTSPAGAIYLKNITNKTDLNIKIVKDGDSLNLGNKTLKFISAPFLHWPDSMFTWLVEEKALFSCDFLGCHYCEPYILDTNITDKEAYLSSLQIYYSAIFSPFKKYVLNGLSKINNLEISFVCPSHGPVLTKNGILLEIIDKYKTWSDYNKNLTPTIPIFYCSAYGNTERIAKAISEGIKNQMPNINVPLYNIIKHNIADLTNQLNLSDAFLIGSPTINKNSVPPIWNLLSTIDVINNTKKSVATFGSFGWSGEATEQISNYMSSMKLSVFEEKFKVCFVPTEQDIKNAISFGEKFAKSLNLTQK